MERYKIILGLIGSYLTIILVFISTLVSKNFSWTGNYLSDIGAGKFGQLPALIFNFGLIIGGFILIIFFILSFSYKKNKTFKISIGLMAYSTFSLAMIGVFTENSPYNLHLIFSYGFFLLFPLAMIILSTTFFKSNFYFFILTILMAFVAIGVIINLPLGNGKAIPEILEAIFLVIWISIFDILMYEHKF